jgi:hypothetical protein
MGPRKQGSVEDVSKLKVAELKARLEEIGESTKGKKAELVARLEQALQHGVGEEAQVTGDAVEEQVKESVEAPGEAAVEVPRETERPVSRKPASRKADAIDPVVAAVADPVADGATAGVKSTQKLTASQRMNLKKKMRKQRQREARNAWKAEVGKQGDKAGASLKRNDRGQGVVTYEVEETRLAPEVNMSEEVCLCNNGSTTAQKSRCCCFSNLESRPAARLRAQISH